jgi:hypothetical protein
LLVIHGYTDEVDKDGFLQRAAARASGRLRR